jgi:hypothetical protein
MIRSDHNTSQHIRKNPPDPIRAQAMLAYWDFQE